MSYWLEVLASLTGVIVLLSIIFVAGERQRPRQEFINDSTTSFCEERNMKLESIWSFGREFDCINNDGELITYDLNMFNEEWEKVKT